MFESTALSSHWFQVDSNRGGPYSTAAVLTMEWVDGVRLTDAGAMVGQCKLDPNLKAPGFKV